MYTYIYLNLCERTHVNLIYCLYARNVFKNARTYVYTTVDRIQ